MSEGWQQEQYRPQEEAPVMSLRMKWSMVLASELERIEEEFVVGGNKDKYHEELQDLNEKLSIIGFTLVSKPWLKPGSGTLR